MNRTISGKLKIERVGLIPIQKPSLWSEWSTGSSSSWPSSSGSNSFEWTTKQKVVTTQLLTTTTSTSTTSTSTSATTTTSTTTTSSTTTTTTTTSTTTTSTTTTSTGTTSSTTTSTTTTSSTRFSTTTTSTHTSTTELSTTTTTPIASTTFIGSTSSGTSSIVSTTSTARTVTNATTSTIATSTTTTEATLPLDYYDADSSSDSAKWAITSDNTPDYNSDYSFVGFTDDSGSSESSFDPSIGRSDRSGNQGTNRMKRSTSSFSHQSSIDDLSNFVSLGKTIQESVIQFIQTEKPEHRFFETDAVLVEGNYTFKLSIDTDGIDWNSDGLFIDYIALLPSQYYEPNILKKKITEPCSYSEKVGGKCMMYDHVGLSEYHTIDEYSLHKLPLLNFDIEPALLFNTTWSNSTL